MEFIMNYVKEAQTEEGFRKWAEEWVYNVENHSEYIKKLGIERLMKLRAVKGLGFRPRTWLRR